MIDYVLNGKPREKPRGCQRPTQREERLLKTMLLQRWWSIYAGSWAGLVPHHTQTG